MKNAFRVLLVLTVLVASAYGGMAVTAWAQSGVAGWYNFDTNVKMAGDLAIADDLDVTDDITADDATLGSAGGGVLTVNGTTVITGNTSIGNGSSASTLAVWGDQSNNANFILQGWQRMDGEPFTVEDGRNITPTNTYMELSSSGTVTAAGIVAGTEGDLLILVNVGAQNIVLPDSGTLKLSGGLTLAASDSVVLIADGTNWVQLATSNN
jgi:hypothetical protein